MSKLSESHQEKVFSFILAPSSWLARELGGVLLTLVLLVTVGSFKDLDKLPLRSASEIEYFLDGEEAASEHCRDMLTP
jgi:hypothetical protein